MRLSERIYIYFSLIPMILTFLFFDGFMDLAFGRMGAEVLLLLFTLISFILGISGVALMLKAYTKKSSFWPLIPATLMASSLFIAILGRFVLKIF